MDISSNFILSLWLIPLVAFLFLPLTLTVASFPLSLFKRCFFAKKTMVEERREHLRFVPCRETFAEVVANGEVHRVQVSDFSKKGISFKLLPDIVFEKAKELSVVIEEFGMKSTLLVNPKWVLQMESGNQMGAQINTASPGWGDFLQQVEKTGN